MSLRPIVRNFALFLSGPLLLAGCASEAPYVYTDYRHHQRGQVIVCYDDRTAGRDDAKVLAEDICRQYDRTAQFILQQPYQCSWTAPTQALFSCVPRPGETPKPVAPHMAPMRHDPQLPAQ